MTETWHNPYPGSRLHAAQSAEQHAEPDLTQPHASMDELSGIGDLTPVPVTGTPRVAIGDDGVYRTNTVAPSAMRQLLPQDPQRYRALVLAVDNDVILCDTKDLASSPNNSVANVPNPDGFYLPKGVPLPLANKGLVWVVNTSSSASTRVSVVIERYDRAQPESG